MDQPLELLSELADKLGTLVESTSQRGAESVAHNDLSQLSELLQRIIRNHTNRSVDKHLICKLDSKITSCSKELNEHEASVERDRRTLEEETAKNIKRNAEMKKALEEQRKANEDLRILVEEQKSEKKQSLRKVNEIEGRIRKGRGDKVVGRENVEIEKKLAEARKCKNELQEARKALIEVLVDMQSSSPAGIGVKRMGEINEKAFENACEKRDSTYWGWVMASFEYSLWQEKLKNRSVINEDDESLKNLRDEWGDEVHNMVSTALTELREYKAASGCYPIFELWNYEENRKATTKEVIEYMLTQWRKA